VSRETGYTIQQMPNQQPKRLPHVVLGMAIISLWSVSTGAAEQFEGKHFRGRGDVEYLQLLDSARRLFEPDPEFQNLAMLYIPRWNGLVEGPTWSAWWIQNSYGTTYGALPFLQEPFLTFLQNSQDLWFDQMGDGKREGCPSQPQASWAAPDGQLCDAAWPGCIIYKQGDGRTKIHDWGLEFTAAGIVLQSELLLISRDAKAIAHYLPRLERSANFLEARRDPENNLFLAGPAANLLAPSYAGWKRPDGSYDKAYLAGLSITYIAALDRLIELEKLAGQPEKVRAYTERRGLARKGLPLITTPEGYFIKSLDPDGTKHGVYGASQHGYFEASPNHDAICFHVVDDAQAEKIYAKIASISGLRPYDFVIANYPSLDDMYEAPVGIWRFGEWVNGGHWSTCEARMVMAYYRLGKYEDARRSLRKLFSYAHRFRMDNPLTDFGNNVYQPKEPVNLTYDAFGPAAAFVRGLFEYQYQADSLTLAPHIPPGISQLEQLDPIRFGSKKLYVATTGQGPITSVTVNGMRWKSFGRETVSLPYGQTPKVARIVIALGGAPAKSSRAGGVGAIRQPTDGCPRRPQEPPLQCGPTDLGGPAASLCAFHKQLVSAGLGESYEAAHAQLVLDVLCAAHKRRYLLRAGKLPRLEEASQAGADKSYEDTATKLLNGLDTAMKTYQNSPDPRRRGIYQIYVANQQRQ